MVASWTLQTVGNLCGVSKNHADYEVQGCLRQALTLLQVYAEDVDLLMCEWSTPRMHKFTDQSVIGQNWLLRAQKSLSKIHHAERSSMSSGSAGSQDPPLSASEERRRTIRATVEAEDRLHSADYVEARGILLPAVEYLKHAVEAARSQNRMSGFLLARVRTFHHEYIYLLIQLNRLQKRA